METYLFIFLMLLVAIVLLYRCVFYCYNKEYSSYNGTPVAVTQVTTTSGVQPPYPTNPLHPTPQSMPPPGPGFVPLSGYQTAPYPPIMAGVPGGTPYPATNAPYPSATPYPPTQPVPPPSYSEAVGQVPVQPPPVNEQYAKQSPYNPNF